AEVGVQARKWVDDLISMHDLMEDALIGEAPPAAPAQPAETAPVQAAEQHDSSQVITLKLPDSEWVEAVEEALVALNNPARLARCRLSDRIPSLLMSARSSWGT